MAVPLHDPGPANGNPEPPAAPSDGCSGYLRAAPLPDIGSSLVPATVAINPGPGTSMPASISALSAGNYAGLEVLPPEAPLVASFAYRLRVRIPEALVGVITTIPIGLVIYDGDGFPVPLTVTVTPVIVPAGVTVAPVQTGGYWALQVTPVALGGTYDVVVKAEFAPLRSEDVECVIAQYLTTEVQIYESAWTLEWWSWGCQNIVVDRVLSRNDCLGSGSYEIELTHRRTGLTPRAAVISDVPLKVLSCEWEREQDTTTSASVTIEAFDECTTFFAGLDPSVIEVTILRDEDNVWSGPISDVDDSEAGRLTLTMVDVSSYAMNRIAVPRTWVATDAAQVAYDIITDALALDDPGEITVEWHPCGVRIDKTITPDDYTLVSTIISEMSQTLIDWVVVDRTIIIGGRNVAENPPLDFPLVDEHFTEPPGVSTSAALMATRVIVKGNGVVGVAGGPRSTDGVLIDRVFDDSSIVIQADADAAAQNILALVQEPVTTVDGSGTQLRPSAPIDVQMLIPGIEVPVSLGRTVQFDGVLALQSVSASYDGVAESISVSLAAATDQGVIA